MRKIMLFVLILMMPSTGHSQVNSLGIITPVITGATPPPGAQPPWSELYLPSDGSNYATITFNVSPEFTPPSSYQVLVNGRVPVSACDSLTVPISFACTNVGKFEISFQSTGFLSVTKYINCVPPTQVPGGSSAPGTSTENR